MKTSSEIRVGDIWNEEKKAGLQEFILAQSKRQTKERLLKNKLLSIQYQIEDWRQRQSISHMQG